MEEIIKALEKSGCEVLVCEGGITIRFPVHYETLSLPMPQKPPETNSEVLGFYTSIVKAMQNKIAKFQVEFYCAYDQGG